MDELCDILEKIRPRPALYLGTASMELLRAYLHGYLHHCDNVNGLRCLTDFTIFVRRRYKMNDYWSHDWACFIQFFEPDPYQAFDTFYELFDEFIAKRKRG